LIRTDGVALREGGWGEKVEGGIYNAKTSRLEEGREGSVI